MKDIILHIENITKTFSKINTKGKSINNELHTLLDELTFSVPAIKITALIGGNGSGKTTLFNLISSFIKPDKGQILFFNGKSHTLNKLQPHKIARIGIGRLFQDNHLFQQQSVLENMLIADDNLYGENAFQALFKQKRIKQVEENRIEQAKLVFTNLFGNDNVFWEKRNHIAGSLSSGQQRLLGLARLLMADYKLILLDEPTAGVNPKINDQIVEVVKKMARIGNCTIFLIEHNMKFVGQVADYCAFINKGKIESTGSPFEVINNEYVRKIYLGG